MEEQKNTEGKILEAARKVFVEKGMEGARMQEIADEAGINKALLHYYYRSKEKLFEAVFNSVFIEMTPSFHFFLDPSGTIEDKLEKFISDYIDLIRSNPYFPQFVFHELNRNPDRLLEIFKSSGIRPDIAFPVVQKQIEEQGFVVNDIRHLIVSIIGMCIFPFIGKPIIKGMMFNNSDEDFEIYIEERKKEITEFVIKAIKK